MLLKINKRDPIVYYFIAFLILGTIFVCFDFGFRNRVSFTSISFFYNFLLKYWIVVISSVLAALVLWKLKPWSSRLFILTTWINTFWIVQGLFLQFNKILAIAIFFYISISYFIYQLLKNYLESACFSPNLDESNLFKPKATHAIVKVVNGDEIISGALMNWDEESAFIYLERPMTNPTDLLHFVLEFDKNSYDLVADIKSHTSDMRGFGVRLKDRDVGIYSWAVFYSLTQQYGFDGKRMLSL